MSSITRFDVKKADEQMKNLEDEIKVVKNYLKHLTDYAIAWYQKLKDKYGKGRERKTEIRLFDRVEAAKVALANIKLYMNREDGFIGSGLRKDEFIADCSDIDEIIVFREDGKCIITNKGFICNFCNDTFSFLTEKAENVKPKFACSTVLKQQKLPWQT